jgi:hypothetical protein
VSMIVFKSKQVFFTHGGFLRIHWDFHVQCGVAKQSYILKIWLTSRNYCCTCCLEEA